MIKKIVFSAAVVLASLFLCGAGCGNVAVSSPAPSIVINFSDDFFGWGDSSGGSQQDNSGGGGTFNLPSGFKILTAKTQSNPSYDDNKMYIFIHFTGDSAEGNFIQRKPASVLGSAYTAYPKDIQFQMAESNFDNIKGSEIQTFTDKTEGVLPNYDNTLGFSSANGKKLNMNFYYGLTDFNVRKNGSKNIVYSLFHFVIWDKSVQLQGFGGGYSYPDFARCNTTRFTVPMNKFDSTKHKNWAFFTVHLKPKLMTTGDESGSFEVDTVTFDGFAPKN